MTKSLLTIWTLKVPAGVFVTNSNQREVRHKVLWCHMIHVHMYMYNCTYVLYYRHYGIYI